MAQTGYTPISIYYSATATNTPTAGNLVAGELAINTADGKLFYKDSAGVVQTIAGKGGAGVAGGSTTQVQYNSSGSLAGSANMTFSGTALTLANDASISGLTVGKGGSAVSTNTAVGNTALTTNSSGAFNTAIGYQTGYSNTTGDVCAVGAKALYSNTTGVGNVALGGYANGTGIYAALQLNTTGSYNTAVGNGSLQANTTASNNTAVGYQAGYSLTTGGNNVLMGYYGGIGGAGSALTTATANTFIGPSAGYLVTTGSKNTFLGAFSGNSGSLDLRTASNYIVLSDGDGNPRGVFDGSGNFLIGTTTVRAKISNDFNGSTNNGIALNDTASAASTAYAAFYVNGSAIGSIVRVGSTSAVVYNTTSDQRLKSNIVDANPVLDKLMNVKVRQFDWTDGDLHQDAGFIAQELAPVLSGIVTEGKTAEDMWQVDYSRLTPYLVKAIQELKAEFDAYKATHP